MEGNNKYAWEVKWKKSILKTNTYSIKYYKYLIILYTHIYINIYFCIYLYSPKMFYFYIIVTLKSNLCLTTDNRLYNSYIYDFFSLSFLSNIFKKNMNNQGYITKVSFFF